jgi:NADH dehydrogenase FAD-containing subunit
VRAEIAEFLNGYPRWLSSSSTKVKATIAVVTKNTKLLPSLGSAAATKAGKSLEHLGIDVLYGKKITKTTPYDAGQTTTTLFSKQAWTAHMSATATISICIDKKASRR